MDAVRGNELCSPKMYLLWQRVLENLVINTYVFKTDITTAALVKVKI